ncbi:MAG TPA: glycoside hydrolase family 3 C-terminal domain-containing protein, partial [Candidatus Paenibacillus intestinavium]|nr:glycoside hydrolase family 3 C-terminal domain-containing protein [Candidatus Paenibacillus intestinavium]
DVKKVVKEEWNMDGFIVSDAGDLLGIVNDHHYYDNYKEAVAHSIKAGIDSITDDKEKSCNAIREALAEGLLTEQDLDTALFNTFRVRFKLGEFDPAELNPYANVPESKLMAPEHAELALRAAKSSIVLLKNEGNILPLQADKLQSVAVIGPLANIVFRDWYAGTLPYKVTVLEAVERKLAGKSVSFASSNNIITLAKASTKQSFAIDADDENRMKLAEANEEATQFELTNWDCGSYTLLNTATNKLLTTADDKHLAANADEAFGWFVKEVIRLKEEQDQLYSIQSWNNKAIKLPQSIGEVITVDEEAVPTADDQLLITVMKDGIEEAKTLAANAEQAIVVVGNNPLINGKEEIDRPSLELAADQVKLIEEVLAVNPNTVVVIVGGYPFVLGDLADKIPAIIYLSHAGQELGNAVADVLFGDYSPAGRLNMTWYRGEEQLTDLLDYDIMKSKRTYQYLEDKPLYPFGHGLSYASFVYSDFNVTTTFDAVGQLVATVTVSNTSSMTADEVVQIYVTVIGSRVKRPIKKLVAFERVTLQAGETKVLTLPIHIDQLQMWDVTRDRFVLEQASYNFQVGSTSADIRIEQSHELAGEVIPARNLTVWTRAENYDQYTSVYLDESKEGTTCVRAVGEQGSIVFENVDSSLPHAKLQARVAGGEAGGQLQVKSKGEVIGSVAVAPSGEQQWSDVVVELQAINDDLEIELIGSVKISGFKLN